MKSLSKNSRLQIYKLIFGKTDTALILLKSKSDTQTVFQAKYRI